MGTMIRTEGLKKIYRVGKEKVVALAGIDLEIEEGEICCIVGQSGSGKSTLLNMLAGLEKPTKGEIVIAGKRVTAMDEERLALFRQENLGFIFQSFNLLPQLTAVENAALPLSAFVIRNCFWFAAFPTSDTNVIFASLISIAFCIIIPLPPPFRAY